MSNFTHTRMGPSPKDRAAMMREGHIDTHDLIVDFGKHQSERWTRVPVSYLHWLVNAPERNGSNAKAIARAELKRRGSVLPTIEVSGHSIDRASLYCRKIWHRTALDANEGIHAWLVRIAQATIDESPRRPNETQDGVRYWQGLKMVFQFGEAYPTLKTIMPSQDLGEKSQP